MPIPFAMGRGVTPARAFSSKSWGRSGECSIMQSWLPVPVDRPCSARSRQLCTIACPPRVGERSILCPWLQGRQLVITGATAEPDRVSLAGHGPVKPLAR